MKRLHQFCSQSEDPQRSSDRPPRRNGRTLIGMVIRHLICDVTSHLPLADPGCKTCRRFNNGGDPRLMLIRHPARSSFATDIFGFYKFLPRWDMKFWRYFGYCSKTKRGTSMTQNSHETVANCPHDVFYRVAIAWKENKLLPKNRPKLCALTLPPPMEQRWQLGLIGSLSWNAPYLGNPMCDRHRTNTSG